ncbi:MAG: beta-galactosidase [Kiritimatiellae bacterium]|nr:beta-galactosidase [Kiritimatiellia bacterium]
MTVRQVITGLALITFAMMTADAAETPCAGRRVGIFHDAGFPGGSRGVWYRDIAQALGCDVQMLTADDLTRTNRVSRRKLDVLILPDGQNIPYESAYALPHFLAEGGSVIAGRLPEWAMGRDPQGNNWIRAVRLSRPNDPTVMQENLMSDFQLRHVGGPSAQRSLATNLTVNPKWPDDIKSNLPATAGPLSKTFQLADKIWYKEYKGTPVDNNIETAANILFPVYLLPSGEATDFLVYRYHNSYFNGATLVLLGETGKALLAGERGRDVLSACIRFCSMRLPNEREAPCYERLIALHRRVSEYGREFSETFPLLRDVALSSFYRQDLETHARIRSCLDAAEAALTEIITEKQAIDKKSLADENPQDQDRRRIALLNRITLETRRLATMRNDAVPELRHIRYPATVSVRSPLGRIPVEAGESWCGLYALRRDFFKTIKALGINGWYLYGGYFFYPYLDDPAVRAEMEGLKLDLSFGCGSGVRSGNGWHDLGETMPGQGRLDLATGKVEETKWKTYDTAGLEKAIRGFLEYWEPFPILRVYMNTAESGLHNRFWGEQARQEYVAHLKERYGSVEKLNRRWGTEVKDFSDIQLPTARPVTPVEHAQWEDWINFREFRLYEARLTGYKLFKKHAPGLLVSSCISTESVNKQAYSGIDLYQLSKPQDISGPDGTTAGVAQEWKFLDLHCGRPVFSVEWGLFYFPKADMLRSRKELTRQLWWEVSGGHVGINLWYFRWPGFKANYVDTTGLTTLLGWELKQDIADFRKIEHVLLDGKRVSPATLILFSNTSRVHDQSWGLKGEPVFSCHLNAVKQVYHALCKQHEPARVIDEGAILDGTDLSSCRLLIVSHAQYLSAEVQKALLAYVDGGGTLFWDGMSGQFDNYGNAGQSLFQKACVVPRAMPKGTLAMADGNTYEPSAKAVIYSPQPLITNDQHVVLNYASGEPAVVAQRRGKGKLILSGLPLSDAGKDMAGALAKLLFREAGMTPAYVCPDESLLIREWEYDGSRYLICAYPEGKELLSPFRLGVRGDYTVRDTLLGLDVPVTYDGTYTVMEGLITSPGGRVYRLQPGRASVGRRDKKLSANNAPAVSKPTGEPVKAELPFSGNLFERDERIELGDYTVQAVLIPEGTAPDKGRAFLTVSRGSESGRQELEAGKETRFVFRDETLRVRYVSGFFMFPMHVKVDITREPREIPERRR